MADKTYKYNGPISSVTLAGGREVTLHPGAEVALPEDNAWVRSMVAQKRLTAMPVAAGSTVDKKEVADVG